MSKQPSKQRIRIRLKGYDQRVLDRAIADIVETAKRTGAQLPADPPSYKREISRFSALPTSTESHGSSLRSEHTSAC